MTGDISTEIARIETVMTENPREYYRDEPMQERYRALLSEKDEADPGQTGDGGFIPVVGFEQWKKGGGDPMAYQDFDKLASASNDLLWGMPDGAREQFGVAFSALPERVRSLAFGTLMERTPVLAPPLSDSAMSELRRDPAYAELAEEWGRMASYRFAVAQERLWRIADHLSDAEYGSLKSWLDRLPRAAVKAVMRRLAEG